MADSVRRPVDRCARTPGTPVRGVVRGRPRPSDAVRQDEGLIASVDRAPYGLATPTRDRTGRFLGRRSRIRERTLRRGGSAQSISSPDHEPSNWFFGQQAWWTVGTAALIRIFILRLDRPPVSEGDLAFPALRRRAASSVVLGARESDAPAGRSRADRDRPGRHAPQRRARDRAGPSVTANRCTTARTPRSDRAYGRGTSRTQPGGCGHPRAPAVAVAGSRERGLARVARSGRTPGAARGASDCHVAAAGRVAASRRESSPGCADGTCR